MTKPGLESASSKGFAEMTEWERLDHLWEDGFCEEAEVTFGKAFYAHKLAHIGVLIQEMVQP